MSMLVTKEAPDFTAQAVLPDEPILAFPRHQQDARRADRLPRVQAQVRARHAGR